MKRILITGAAGFIGYHLCSSLKQRGDVVIGIDNFNAYYDPALKQTRSRHLHALGISVERGDICDQPFLLQLLRTHKITHIVHLAAQAGVRHSLEKPNDYVHSNLQGFVSILESCRLVKDIKLVYASSSSVYGLNRTIPFKTQDTTDHPTNLYGATKKANEVMAHAYHHLYGFPVVALRYFTVYGPWGRPDMAYYHFARHISRGEPIELFNQGNMQRDFTYIDDIVRGTVEAIDRDFSYEIFNLGNSRPIDLHYLIEVLEQGLGKKAIQRRVSMQMGEVTKTYADLEKSKLLLDYEPQVSFEEGMKRFIEWYQGYELSRNQYV